MFTFFACLAAAIIAGVVTWVAARIVLLKGAISTGRHIALQQLYDEQKTTLAVLSGIHGGLQATASAQESELQTLRADYTALLKNDAAQTADLATLQANHLAILRELQALKQEHRDALNDTATLEAKLTGAKEREQTLLADRIELGDALKKEFSLMAGQMLDAKAQQFNQQQETKLTDLLNPFKKQIEDFGKQVTDKFLNEGKEKSALQREIELLHKSSGLLSKQAADLTEALRGSSKMQGDWGEGILEQILEFCGLKEGVHYTAQSASRSEEGTGIRPDVIVHLPGSRRLVIDAKVSLLDYWNLCAEEKPDARAAHLPRITSSLRRHIDGLHRKPYNEVAGTPDYLVMFVPVEAAYITALQHDNALWQYAYNKGVVLISPTNLIPFIRVVQTLWDRDDKYKNAEAIADKAGKLYDKLVSFVGSFQNVGKELESAQKAWNDGMGQLSTGRDNLIRQAEKMKALNISNKKDLPASLTGNVLVTEGLQLP